MKPNADKVLTVSLIAGLVAFLGAYFGKLSLLMLGVALPVSLACGGPALVAAFLPAHRESIFRAGLFVLALLGALTIAMFLISATDWVHILWNVEFPLAGLFFGSGLLLVRVWPEERRVLPGLMRDRNGATVALLGAVVLGSIPFWIALSPIEPWPSNNVEVSPVSALVESARYGFDRDLPAFLQTENPPRLPGGPTHPPRSATVMMAASALAAGFWILFVLLSFLGRALPAGEARWKFLLLSPLFLVPATLSLFGSRAWNVGIWENELWLAAAYGPLLLSAAVATLALFTVARYDQRRAQLEA